MLYANFILDGSTQTTINKLKVQQNNAIRAVLSAEYRTPSAKLYADSNIGPIDVNIKKTVIKIVYKSLNNVGAPVYNQMYLTGSYVVLVNY